MTVRGYISEICFLYVLITLLFSASGKTISIRSFARNLSGSFRVPEGLASPAAVAIVGAEWIILGLLLAGGVSRSIGLAAFLTLMLIFTAAVGIALFRGGPVWCNCFGSSPEPLSLYDLFRNALLIGAACLGLAWLPGAPFPGIIAYVLFAGIGLILFLLSTNLRQMARLAAHGEGIQ